MTSGRATQHLQVRVLGTLEVVGADGAPVALASPKLRRLLAGLAMHAGSVVSVDRLADIVWGDEPPAHAVAALHSLVSRLRGRLRASGDADDVVATAAPGYVLRLGDRMLDAAVFTSMTADARDVATTAPDTAADLLDRALALWRGDAYAEFRDEAFARAEAARLAELRATAQELRVELALARGEVADAVARLELLTDEHPLRERPHGQLMVALYRAGRQADALEVYRRYRARVGDELGLEPSADLQRIEQQVLRSDPALSAPSSSRPPPPGRPHQPAGAAPAAGPPSAGSPPAPRRSLLPIPAAELIGRDDLLARIRAALAVAPLVTLTGPGGVGKTSVALRAADDHAADHRDGAWLCELASIDRDEAVIGFVMTALDIRPRPGIGPLDRLVEVLRSRRVLLVLDNAEHVVDGVAALVDAVVRTCPATRVLVTSRERIGVTGEHVVAVPPLPVTRPAMAGASAADDTGPAVELFVRRAAAASDGFALTADNRVAVVGICRALDGLPLALELAATRMRSMAPSDLAERLTWRFRVLRGGARTGAQRHRTLRAVVDWSYDLLDERQRHVFELLSVFAGGFTLDAAEQVVAAAAEIDVIDVASAIAGLVDASMVVAQTAADPARYTLLETLRAYGRERLAERGTGPTARRAHAVHHIALTERVAANLFSTGPPGGAGELDQAIDEVRAAYLWCVEHDLELALRLAGALPPYAEHRAHGEAYGWAERIVTAAEDAGTAGPAATGAYGAAALGARFRGDFARATALAQRSCALADDPDDPATYTARYTLAEVALYEGRLDEALRLTDELERVPVSGMNRVFAVWLNVSRVLAQAYAGRADAAISEAERFRADGAHEGVPIHLAWATYALAEALVEVDPERALPVAEDALRRSRELDDRFLTGVALVTVASLHARHGDPGRAVALFRETVDRWHRAGNWTQQWVAVRSIVGLLLRLGATDDAAVLHGIVTSRTTASTPFGADAARLSQAAVQLTARLGGSAAAAQARGAAMRDDEAIEWIREVLDRATDGTN